MMANLMFSGPHPDSVWRGFELVNEKWPHSEKGYGSSDGSLMLRDGPGYIELYFISCTWTSSTPRYGHYPLNNEEKVYFGCRSHWNSSNLRVAIQGYRLNGSEGEFHFYTDNFNLCIPGGPRIVTPGQSNYLELGYDGTNCIVRVDGVEVYRETKALGTINGIWMGKGSDNEVEEVLGWSATGRFYLQDIYINNGEGESCNSFLGDIHVDRFPVTLDGTQQTGFSGKSGGILVSEIDEYPSDKGASYVEGVQLGSRCTFKAEPQGTRDLKSLYLHGYGTKMGASETGVKLIATKGDQPIAGEKLQFPIGEWADVHTHMPTQPDGSEWDWEGFTESEFGLEIVP